jgi:HEPN domain-containing protein
VDPVVAQHLSASDRNLTIAANLISHPVTGVDPPPHEWAVTVAFYSAVRCINAYLAFQEMTIPRTHAQRSRAMQQVNELLSIVDAYTQLENWSRDARYTLPYTAFNIEYAQSAIDSADMIREHVRGLLPDA